MSNTPGGIARTVGLWVLIVCDLAFIFVLFWKGNPWWGWVAVGITLWIVGWELWGKFFSGENKTISTKYKEWIQKVGWWGYLALGLFLTAMIGLVVHLAFW